MKAAAPLTTETQTFVFADLAGFTALTEAHGDQEAIEIAQRFIAQVRALLPEHDAEEVKTIGDEVMIRCADCLGAATLGLRIIDELAEHRSPPVRVGMHCGPAVNVDGDWFGATVNLASRVSGAARPGEVLMTAATVDGLPSQCSIEVHPRGARYFKHIPQRVPVYRVTSGPPGPDYAIDPVCRMAVDPARAASARSHARSRYHFCSQDCADAFTANPRRYIAQSPAARLARGGFRFHLRVFLAAQFVFVAVWAVEWAAAGSPHSWILFALIPWAIGLGLHYRAVRSVL